jgi:hypothetical protein
MLQRLAWYGFSFKRKKKSSSTLWWLCILIKESLESNFRPYQQTKKHRWEESDKRREEKREEKRREETRREEKRRDETRREEKRE